MGCCSATLELIRQIELRKKVIMNRSAVPSEALTLQSRKLSFRMDERLYMITTVYATYRSLTKYSTHSITLNKIKLHTITNLELLETCAV
jgi:hypothetical protein